MRTIAIIEARMQSSRLPGKVLLPVLGKPLLELMIERLKRVSELDGIVVASVADASCDPIHELADRLGVGCFRGSEDDVLDRVLRAARHFRADIIVETTGDCPLIDAGIVSSVIQRFRQNDVDFCANTLEMSFPRGMDVKVFSTDVLAEVASLTSDQADHEHVSLYIYQHPERYKLMNVLSGFDPKESSLRLTVDTPEDFALIRAIFEALYPFNPAFTIYDILAFLRARPELSDINRHVIQKPVR